MYLYWFNKYAWVDKVWKSDWNFKPGDLIQLWEDFYVALWKEVSFFEQYVYWVQADPSKTALIHKKLLNKQTLELLHRMVYQRYSTYKNTVKLFLPQEIDKLIDRKLSKKTKKTNAKDIHPISLSLEEREVKGEIKISQNWQTLLVFPDLRTLINLTDPDFREDELVDTLLSSNTQNQKDKSRRNIKNWNTQVILATHSEIFQNYKNLQKIFIVQPHKRYYSNQQDPRYKTLEVVQKLAKIWNCELQIIENL